MPNLSSTVTFLFAGDGSLASDGLSVFLQTKSNFIMVAECSEGSRAISDIETHSPEIAVIDAQLPDLSADKIVRAVRQKNQQTKIIILGATADRTVADALLAAGADAYIVRSGPSRHLNDAIRYVRDGGKYLAPELTKDSPATAEVRAMCNHREDIENLRSTLDAQERTVERLENAMERAQHAIELLQQKVEQLSGTQIEAPAYDEAARSRIPGGLRTKLGAVAAALMVGVMGFVLAGALHPGQSGLSAVEIATLGTEDSLRAGSTGSLHLENWEMDTVANATTMLRNRQYAATEKACRDLLKQNPGNLQAARLLASALFHQDRISESADVIRSMAVPVASAGAAAGFNR